MNSLFLKATAPFPFSYNDYKDHPDAQTLHKQIQSLYRDPETVPIRRELIHTLINDKEARNAIVDTAMKEMLVPSSDEFNYTLAAVFISSVLPIINRISQRISQLRHSVTMTLHKDRYSEDDLHDDITTAKAVPITNFLTPNAHYNPTKLFNCPLHNDATPSFKYYKATNSFYCFGCKKGGDSISFIKERDKLNFKEAVKFLCQKH